MKTIIAGSRGIEDYELLEQVMERAARHGITPTEVFCGEARGVDTLGKRWAQERGIPVRSYPADWNRYGKSAGIRRNEQMGAAADAAVILWDGHSKGSLHMAKFAKVWTGNVYVVKVKEA